MKSQQVMTSYRITDEILESYRTTIGKDFDGYRNHVTRMLNFCFYLMPKATKAQKEKLQIAAAFHDIALWTHDRVDYLVPSYEESHKYLKSIGKESWIEEVQIIIDMHHLLKPYKGPFQDTVEIFRKADLVDFSLGLKRNGIDKQFVQAVKRALPNCGFHKTLIRFSVKQLFRNPFKPTPMMRMKNHYE